MQRYSGALAPFRREDKNRGDRLEEFGTANQRYPGWGLIIGLKFKHTLLPDMLSYTFLLSA